MSHFVLAFSLSLENTNALIVSSVVSQIFEPIAINVAEKPLDENNVVLENALGHFIEGGWLSYF